MTLAKVLMDRLQGTIQDLGIAGDLTDLAKTRRKIQRLSKWVTANERDVRIWFTGLDGFFEGTYLEDYPKDYKQAIQAPWPQPSPHAPEELPKTVLHVPEAEVTEFLEKVVARYLSTLKSDWWDAVRFTHQTGVLRETSDARFGDMYLVSPLGKSLTQAFDREDEEFLIAAGVEPSRVREYWKVDYSLLEGVDLFPEMVLEPCVIYFVRTETKISPVLIRLRKVGILPPQSQLQPRKNSEFFWVQNRSAWETAKQLSLQSGAVHLIASMHPVVHFPVDSINAITKAVLPEGHPLRELLLPHCYMQLPLNFAVLYIDRSVAHNHQREIYSALPTKRSGFFELMKRGYSGYQGKAAFPKFMYRAGPPEIPTPYGEFLRAYYPPILRFAKTVCNTLDPHDESVKRWMKELHSVLPGFPALQDESAALDLGLVAEVAASFIHNCAVVHSADHHCYAKLPLDQVPLRMRVGEKEIRESEHRPIGQKIRKSDLFRHRMAWKMYFRPTNLKLFKDVKYAFHDENSQKAYLDFMQELRNVDQAWDGEKYIHLDEMACSIQY